ncbi:MAG: hypothetical protein H7Y18_07625 [Clostridiaceae bacterium]|nr:hypothetical protein [Clostridiaceae bacterium]
MEFRQKPKAPSVPPPSKKPSKPSKPSAGLFLLSSGEAVTPCLHKLTYVWLTSGSEGWMYPIYTDSTTVGGYMWNEFSRRYFYITIDAKNIDVVTCDI